MNDLNGQKPDRSIISSWPKTGGYSIGVFQFDSYPNQDERNVLIEQGVQFVEYLSGRSFLVALRDDCNWSSINELGIKAYAAWSPEIKFLNDGVVPSIARADGNNVLVNLHYFDFIPHTSVTGALGNVAELVELRSTYDYITVKVDESKISQLASLPSVKFIDWKYDYGEPENYTSRTGHRVNYLSPENTNGLDFDGEGVHVMLQDDGFIGPHIDYQGRIVQYWMGNNGDHGDHVGGTIAGAGNLDPHTTGQAPGADMSVYKAAPEYQGFDSISIHYNTKDVVITSTSYSNGCNAGYTAFTRVMDEQTYDMERLVHVFSAGNSGTSNCGYGAGNLWGNITGGHKMGKNTITVGNLTDEDVIATSSSRGPATDGRIKPDVCTKGTNVYSTTDPNSYTTKTGTSMSCPGVSGTLAVLYDAYEDINGALPPSGLMKACVMNTCDDLGNPGPDFIHGWGRVNARKAYELFSNNYIITGSLTDQDSVSHSINVPANAKQLRVMVYWTDPEASIGASTHLVNDIDMSMTDPNGGTHIRWTPDPTPNPVNLDSPAAPGPDHINNVEQIVIDNPTSGTHNVKLKGFNIPSGPQEYFLVYWFEQPQLLVTYPVGGESFTPFSQEMLRWDSPETTGDFTIEYTLDGNNWSVLSSNVSANQSYFYWNIPNAATPDARVRITHNQSGASGTSDPLSILRRPSGLTVIYSCPDSIGLQWNNVPDADSYDVFKLGSKYMEVIGNSSSTTFTDYTSNPLSEDLWYSVNAKQIEGTVSKRVNAIRKSPGIFNCVIPTDLELTTVNPDAGSFYTCHSDSGYSIGVTVTNTGTTPISLFDASYETESGQLFQQSFTTNLAPGATESFLFSAPILGFNGLEEVTVAVSLAGDGNEYNDTIVTHFQEVEEETVLPQFRENFEDFSVCSPASDCGFTVCDLTNGWTNEPNGEVDDIDWRTFFGDTPSDFTGPSSDHNPGTPQGRYLYLEASGDCTFQTANVVSPCIDLVGAEEATLSFWYNMYGAEMGNLNLDVFDGEKWHLAVMPELSGNKGGAWLEQVVDLSDFTGNIINIRFRGTTGSGFRSDMAIDDIALTAPPVANFVYEIDQPTTNVFFTDLSYLSDTMQFSLGDGSVLDSVPFAYNYNVINSFIVEQIVANEIGSDTAVQLIQGLGLNSLEENEVAIYPNPAMDYFDLEQATEGSFQDLVVYDANGRIVMQESIDSGLIQRYDISSLKPGLYMIRLSGKSEIVTPLSIIR